MLSTVVLSLVAIIATCNATACVDQPRVELNPPSVLDEANAKIWHKDELCFMLMCYLFKDLSFESEYFPNKVDDSSFVFSEDSNTYTKAQFKSVVEGAQTAATILATLQVEGLDLSTCEFEDWIPPNGDGDYGIGSIQTVQFQVKKGVSFTLSETKVTYTFNSNHELKSVRMETLSDGGTNTIAGAIEALKDGRRRLMEKESVKVLMKMPNVVSVPLIIAVVILFVFIGVMLCWRTLCYCGSFVFGGKTEKMDDVEFNL